MGETRRVTISPSEQYGHDSLVVEIAGQREGWMKRVCDILYGTSEPGVYNVTVERVEEHWPMVRRRDGQLTCPVCGDMATRTKDVKCWNCKAVLSGEVPQSKVTDFLRQEG